MDMEKLQTLLLQTAEVLEQFRRQSEQASQRHHQSAAQLQQLTEAAPTILRQAAEGSFSVLSGQIRQEVGTGLDQAAEAARHAIRDGEHHLAQATRQSQQMAQQLQRVSRGLWLSTACSIALMAMAWAAGAWLSRHYYSEIRRHQVSAELLRAYDAADVTLCEGRLCANVDVSAKGVGSQRQYKPVHDRAP